MSEIADSWRPLPTESKRDAKLFQSGWNVSESSGYRAGPSKRPEPQVLVAKQEGTRSCWHPALTFKSARKRGSDRSDATAMNGYTETAEFQSGAHRRHAFTTSSLPRDPSPCNSRPGDLKLESKGFRNFCTSIRSIKNAGCTRNLKVFGCSALIWSKKFNRDEGWESWDTGVGTSNGAAAQLSAFSVNSYVYHKGLGGGFKFIYEGRIII